MANKFDRATFRGGRKAGIGYGQIEPNQVWFTRAGMIEAQCKLDPERFSDQQAMPETKYVAATPTVQATKIVAQNGAFLMIDKANHIATIPNKEMSDAGFPMGINYSSELGYDPRKPQRRSFYLTTQDWWPRVGYVEPGMRITTNTVQWAAGTITDADANAECALTDAMTTDEVWGAVNTFLKSGAKTPIYAVVTEESDGELVIGADPTDALGNVYTQVVKAYCNADGTLSFMFQVINKPATN